ncbi:MAG: PEGA domain-containing protein, partial [Methanosarcinaceae archaeon]|nr:PEGA domain-containing protein [Methanosarcinaceae archaeon]
DDLVGGRMVRKTYYLLITAMIFVTLSYNVGAVVTDREISIQEDAPYILSFTVGEKGPIDAETLLEGNIQELALRLEFVQAGEIIKKDEIWGKSGELLKLSYDVSDEDMAKSNEWIISVISGAGEGKGYIILEYPEMENEIPDDGTQPPMETMPPVAHMAIKPNPALQGENVRFDGYGTDTDGEVVVCRWTFPDGTIQIREGSSSTLMLAPEQIIKGTYVFAVQDNDGLWSEDVSSTLYFDLETPAGLELWELILPAVVVVVAALGIWRASRKKQKEKDVEKDRKKGTGSIYATSEPKSALVYLDGACIGTSPVKIDEVPSGEHMSAFIKFCYYKCEKEALVLENITTHIHCDLEEIPHIKLKLSAKPDNIPADGISRSTITIGIEDNNEIPIPVPEDITIDLETSAGVVETPVKIEKGHVSTTSILTSSTSAGIAVVKARCEPILENKITIKFTDAESE